MPKPQTSATDPDPYGWRAGLRRVVANALLVLLAFEVVSLTVGTAQIVAGATSLSILELLPLAAVFLLIRWIVVLPGLLVVLVGLEYVTRRAPFPRVVFLLVAFAPMVWWQLTQSSGDTSWFTGVLGATAVLFAIIARLPERLPGSTASPMDDGDATQPPAEAAVAPR